MTHLVRKRKGKIYYLYLERLESKYLGREDTFPKEKLKKICDENGISIELYLARVKKDKTKRGIKNENTKPGRQKRESKHRPKNNLELK